MIRLPPLAVLAVVLAAVGRSAPCASQRTVLVVGVADAKTGNPLPDVEVILFDLHRIARTDWLGHAVIGDIPAGSHRLRVRKLGYAASDIRLDFQGDSIGPVFMLEPEPPILDTVHVIGERLPERLQSFEHRRRMGIGRFLTDSQLTNDWDRPLAFVAVTRFPGLRTMTDVDGQVHLVSTRGSCGGASSEHGSPPPRLSAGGHPPATGGGAAGSTAQGSCGNSACPVKVFLDDMDLTEQDFDIVRTWDLAGVEYYTGASMPMKYRVSGSACGVLLLWSK